MGCWVRVKGFRDQREMDQRGCGICFFFFGVKRGYGIEEGVGVFLSLFYMKEQETEYLGQWVHGRAWRFSNQIGDVHVVISVGNPGGRGRFLVGLGRVNELFFSSSDFYGEVSGCLHFAPKGPFYFFAFNNLRQKQVLYHWDYSSELRTRFILLKRH